MTAALNNGMAELMRSTATQTLMASVVTLDHLDEDSQIAAITRAAMLSELADRYPAAAEDVNDRFEAAEDAERAGGPECEMDYAAELLAAITKIGA